MPHHNTGHKAFPSHRTEHDSYTRTTHTLHHVTCSETVTSNSSNTQRPHTCHTENPTPSSNVQTPTHYVPTPPHTLNRRTTTTRRRSEKHRCKRLYRIATEQKNNRQRTPPQQTHRRDRLAGQPRGDTRRQHTPGEASLPRNTTP